MQLIRTAQNLIGKCCINFITVLNVPRSLSKTGWSLSRQELLKQLKSAKTLNKSDMQQYFYRSTSVSNKIKNKKTAFVLNCTLFTIKTLLRETSWGQNRGSAITEVSSGDYT